MRRCCRRHCNNSHELKIDYDALSQSLVKAIDKASEHKVKKERDERINAQQTWLNSVGLTATKQPLKALQLIWFIFRFPFISKDKIVDERATIVLSRMVILAILKPFQILFALLGVFSFVACFNVFNFSEWTYKNLFFIAPLFLAWVIYGMIRMSCIEIDKMKDSQILMTILSSITSFVAMIIAIVALFV